MTGHDLAKSNNNLPDKAGQKHEVARVPKSGIVPVNKAKQYLVKVAKNVIQVGKNTLFRIGNKLANIDWGKVFNEAINQINEERSGNYPFEAFSFTTQATQTPKQEQIKANKVESIETKKEKRIKAVKKPKQIRVKQEKKQLEHKKNLLLPKNKRKNKE